MLTYDDDFNSDFIRNIKYSDNKDNDLRNPSDLFEKIRKINNLPASVFKMQGKEEFINIFTIISGIVYIVKEEGYSLDAIDSKEIRSLLHNLSMSKNYYKEKRYIDYEEAERLKDVGGEKYYENSNPTKSLVINWIITKIEEDLRDVRYY